MKKISFTFILLVHVFMGMAQQHGFAPQGAEWYYNMEAAYGFPVTYFGTRVWGEDTIQGHLCSSFFAPYYGANGGIEYVYEEDGIVYWYNYATDGFTVLYDFNADVGDGWTCEVGECGYQITVTSVDSVSWQSHNYKVQWVVSDGELFNLYPFTDGHARIISGLGYDRCVFPYPLPCNGGNLDYAQIDYLRCYLVNGEMLFHEGAYDCEEVVFTPFSVGSEWYYEILNDDGAITYQHLHCVGDTTIGSERPKIIVRTNTIYDQNTGAEVTHEYVYEENGKVYWWNKNLQEFTTLYDFAANAGDEWEIKVGMEILTMHVNGVENFDYEGKPYRMLHVSDEQNLFSGDIVCGIGHLTSFFPERLMNPGKDYRIDGLRCYWIGEYLLYHIDDEDCDAIYVELHNNVDENGPSSSSMTLGVYPNPTNGVLYVQTMRATSLPAQYRITNLMGQPLMHGSLDSETQQINIKSLPAGMYFITIDDQTLKFVKQ